MQCCRSVPARLGLSLFSVLLAGSLSQAADDQYEQPPRLDATDLLGSEALTGDHFIIEREVVNDGLMNRYVVTSEFQRIEAYGESLALERANEQEAIARLRQVKETEAFAEGIAKAAEAPLALSKAALRDPVGVLKGVPRGVSNLLSDASAAVRGVAKGSHRDRDRATMLRDLIGYTSVKRRLAGELAVDPFSSNKVLQTALDDVAWAVFAGGATVDLAMTQTPMAVSLSLRAARGVQSAHSEVWKIPATTLLQASTDALERMGLSSDEAEALAWHSTCTLTHQTRLVSALAAMKDVPGRDAFARLATRADDELACRYYLELAELMWTYHRHRGPLRKLTVDGIAVTMEAVDGSVVLPLRADYVAWTPATESLIAALPSSGKRSVWLTGEVSPRSRRSLERLGVGTHERVFDRHPEGIDIATVLTPERALSSSKAGAENPDPQSGGDAKAAGGIWNGIRSKLGFGDEDEPGDE